MFVLISFILSITLTAHIVLKPWTTLHPSISIGSGPEERERGSRQDRCGHTESPAATITLYTHPRQKAREKSRIVLGAGDLRRFLPQTHAFGVSHTRCPVGRFLSAGSCSREGQQAQQQDSLCLGHPGEFRRLLRLATPWSVPGKWENFV